MIWLNEKKLAERLAQDKVPEHHKFIYTLFLATFSNAFAFFYGFSLPVNQKEIGIEETYSSLFFTFALGFVLWSTYKRNQKADALDYTERLVAISFCLQVKLIAALLLFLLTALAVIELDILDASAQLHVSTFLENETSTFWTFTLIEALMFLYYSYGLHNAFRIIARHKAAHAQSTA
jgi:hypothetical protein